MKLVLVKTLMFIFVLRCAGQNPAKDTPLPACKNPETRLGSGQEEPLPKGCSGWTPQEVKSKKDKKEPIPLCLAARKIQDALDAYNSDPETLTRALPELNSAEFEFKTVTDNTVGGKVGFLILSFGVSRKGESTNDVTYTYEVPTAKPAGLGSSNALLLAKNEKPRDFSCQLIRNLQQAAIQVKETTPIGKTKFKSLTISMAYGATWDETGGITVPIHLVTVGGTLDHTSTDTQTVKLKFQDAIKLNNTGKTPHPKHNP
jgi:hypothetical protein